MSPTLPGSRAGCARHKKYVSRVQPRSTDRGVSTAFGHVLAFIVTVVLILRLMIAADGFVPDEYEWVTKVELNTVDDQLATGTGSVGRTGAAPGESRVRVGIQLPLRVAGTTYTIKVLPTSNELVLTSTDPEVTIRTSAETETSLTAGQVDGNDMTITYDPSPSVKVASQAIAP